MTRNDMPLRIAYIGTEPVAGLVRAAMELSSHEWLMVAAEPEPAEGEAEADVVVLGPDIARPLASAQRFQGHAASAAGLLFLVPDERLERFRSSLPFVPHMASAWTAAASISADVLAQLLDRAVQASARRASIDSMRTRINQQLSGKPTRRHAAEAQDHRLRQLALSESYLAALLTQAPDAFVGMSPDGTVIAWNDAASRLFGMAADVAIGQATADIFPADMAAELRQLMDRGRQEQAVTGREFVLASSHGQRFVRLSLVPVRDEIGTTATLSITIHDVTERRAVDSKLRASENRYRTLTETLPQLVWTCLPDGACDYLSRQWVEYTGIAEAEQLGFEWLDGVIHPQDRQRTLEHWLGAVRGLHPYDIEYRLRGGDGAYRWFKTRGIPIRSNDGSIAQWFGTCTDIEEIVAARELLARSAAELEQRVATELARRRDAEEALRQAQKMETIGNLTGGVAHDFNNLLQVISGNLQLLEADIAGNERAERRARNAMEGVTRGARLASQLLAFGRRQPLAPKVINLGRLIRNMDELIRRALGEAIEVETMVGGGLWNTLVDPGNVENALLNLAINARDAMDGCGRLTIEAGNTFLDETYAHGHGDVTPGQYVLLAVTDTGCGMTPEVIAQVFEPFFTTKPEGRGTGLGLSMVYGFVKQSGGHIKIYSEPGQGSTVKLYLPRSTQSEDVLIDIGLGPISGGGETILVAEDDEAVRETVVAVLGNLGYRILTASDAQSALSIIESGLPIDLLFTDVVMPGPLKSRELARKAKERLPGLAVLFTSGYTDNAIVHGGRLDEGVELLSKPYTREALARRVRHVLGNPV